MTVLIGIPTFRRPERLNELLRSLCAFLPGEGFEVLVVDNDPAASASPVVASFSARLRIRYEREARPGVVFVRNRLVTAALGYEGLIFLDDDEFISAEWARALASARREFPSAILAGPVRYVLPPDLPEAIRSGGFFERPEFEHGRVLELTGTGNSFLPTTAVRVLSRRGFDPAFARCGGEDTEAFTRLGAMGFEIRWVASAVVYETLNVYEAGMSAIIARYRRNGYSACLMRLRDQGRLRLMMAGLARLLFGGSRYLSRRLLRLPLRAQDVATMHSGLGYLDAVRGIERTYYGDGNASIIDQSENPMGR